MIRLIIDNHTASLSSDEKLKIQHENPFTTENGEYTYEITLPMDSVNQKIFGHINRHDVAQKKITFPVMLYSGMTLLLSGTAIVTSVSDQDVGVQLVGNSSATNFIYDDIYIDEMGLDQLFTSSYYINIPVYNNSAGKLMNEHYYLYEASSNTLTLHKGTGEPQRSDQRLAYPSVSYKLSVLLNLVFHKMGISVGKNALNNTFFNDIVVINASYAKTKHFFSDSLPHWTVREFFQNIGQFMGVSFVFYPTKKLVDILSASSFTSENVISITECVDEFDCSFDNDNDTDSAAPVYAYELDDAQQKQYEQIDQNIYNMDKYISASDINQAYEIISAKGDDKYTYSVGIDTVIYAAEANSAAPYGFYLRPIDNLRASGLPQQEATVQLKIIPVHYTTASINISQSNNRVLQVIGTQKGVLVPVVDGSDYLPTSAALRTEVSDDNKIIASITSDSENSYKPDKLHVAIYDDYALQSLPLSFKPIDSESNINKTVFDFPLPYVINLTEYLWYISSQGRLYANPNRKKSLSLQKIAGQQSIGQYINQHTIRYDKSVTYKKQFVYRGGIPDVRAKFIIRGKAYICNNLTFEVDNNGIIPLMEGEFFLIN